jgi:hypothetical protein
MLVSRLGGLLYADRQRIVKYSIFIATLTPDNKPCFKQTIAVLSICNSRLWSSFPSENEYPENSKPAARDCLHAFDVTLIGYPAIYNGSVSVTWLAI